MNNCDRDQHWHCLAFTLIDLGLFCRQMKKLFSVTDCVCKRLSELTHSKAQQTPLSLKQLARLAVRSNMKDVDIVADCYKLPIKKLGSEDNDQDLKDYLSFCCLNAPIRPWILGRVEKHFCYEVVFEVAKRYNMVLPSCDRPSPTNEPTE